MERPWKHLLPFIPSSCPAQLQRKLFHCVAAAASSRGCGGWLSWMVGGSPCRARRTSRATTLAMLLSAGWAGSGGLGAAQPLTILDALQQPATAVLQGAAPAASVAAQSLRYSQLRSVTPAMWGVRYVLQQNRRHTAVRHSAKWHTAAEQQCPCGAAARAKATWRQVNRRHPRPRRERRPAQHPQQGKANTASMPPQLTPPCGLTNTPSPPCLPLTWDAAQQGPPGRTAPRTGRPAPAPRSALNRAPPAPHRSRASPLQGTQERGTRQ